MRVLCNCKGCTHCWCKFFYISRLFWGPGLWLPQVPVLLFPLDYSSDIHKVGKWQEQRKAEAGKVKWVNRTEPVHRVGRKIRKEQSQGKTTQGRSSLDKRTRGVKQTLSWERSGFKGSLGFLRLTPYLTLPDSHHHSGAAGLSQGEKQAATWPRGWPTQPSRFVMVVVPLCNSSGNKQVKGFERDIHTLLSVPAWSLHQSPHQSPSGGGPETQSKACLGLRSLVTQLISHYEAMWDAFGLPADSTHM